MTGSRVPHLQNRNGVYHLRLRVPDDVRSRLGLREVRRSLGSIGFSRAKTLVAIFADRVKEAFVMIVGNDLSREQAVELVHSCFRDLIRYADDCGGFSPTTDRPDLELEVQREGSLDRLVALRDQRLTLKFEAAVHRTAELYLGKSVSLLGPNRRDDLLDGMARAMIEQQHLFLKRLEDRLGTFSPSDPLFQRCTEPVQSTALGSPIGAKPTTGPTLGEAIEAYLTHGKTRWIPKTFVARQVQLGFLNDALGSDCSLADISAADIRVFRAGILAFREARGVTKHLSYSDRQTENAEHRIKIKTASLIFEPCKAFFRWAVEDEGMLAFNPAEKVRMPAGSPSKDKQKSRRPFSDDELGKLFSSPVFTGSKSRYRRFEPGTSLIKDGRFWLPILAHYTGARAGELVQLLVRDVTIDGPIPCISINEQNEGVKGSERKHVKSYAGIRTVPLHPDLIALGWAEFVNSKAKGKGATRLFPEIPFGSDGQASTVFSKWFGRCMDAAGLPDPALVFHSFRHGIEDAFRNSKTPQYITDRVVGHDDGATSNGYGEGVTLEVSYDTIRNLKIVSLVPIITG